MNFKFTPKVKTLFLNTIFWCITTPKELLRDYFVSFNLVFSKLKSKRYVSSIIEPGIRVIGKGSWKKNEKFEMKLERIKLESSDRSWKVQVKLESD